MQTSNPAHAKLSILHDLVRDGKVILGEINNRMVSLEDDLGEKGNVDMVDVDVIYHLLQKLNNCLYTIVITRH